MHRPHSTRLLSIGLLVAALAFAHDSDEESSQIAELMILKPGMVVADVGAGDGSFGEKLARRPEKKRRVMISSWEEPDLPPTGASRRARLARSRVAWVI